MQVHFNHLSLSYDHQAPTLENLTGSLPAGQLTALLGPSGGGKTTLLNLLAGLLTPDAGRIVFDHTDVTEQPLHRRNIGMVFQDYALYPHLSVLDNIAFPLKMAHVKKAERHTQARHFAELVHVDDQLAKRPNALSGGQQQRVALARALIKRPDLLLLDEPLSNLDATLRHELRDEIRRIQRLTGVTTLFVTHDQADALRIADQIIVLAHGRIQQVGTGASLYQHPQTQFVAQFIGLPPLNCLPWPQVAPYDHSLQSLPTAKTVGFRSESLQLATRVADPFCVFPATVTRQLHIGRDLQTTVTTPAGDLLSTALPVLAPHQALQLAATLPGSFLFDRAQACVWEGAAHVKR